MPLSIDIIDSNLKDACLIQEIFKRARTDTQIRILTSVVEAQASLLEKKPHILILNLGVSSVEVRNFLRFFKEDPTTRFIPIVLLEPTGSEADVNLAYEQPIAAFVRKDPDFERFKNQIHVISGFWLCSAELPARRNAVS